MTAWSHLKPSASCAAWAGLSWAVLWWRPAWWWSQTLLCHWSKVMLSFQSIHQRVDCHDHAFPAQWVCNREVRVVKPSPSPVLLFVSPVSVDFILGTDAGAIPICSSSKDGWHPHTASRQVAPSCCTQSLVYKVSWTLWSNRHGLLLHTSCIHRLFSPVPAHFLSVCPLIFTVSCLLSSVDNVVLRLICGGSPFKSGGYFHRASR
jgi:hypothetical protein